MLRRAGFFFLQFTRSYGVAGCGGPARNSRAVACARLEHHRRASAESTSSSRDNRIWYLVSGVCRLLFKRNRMGSRVCRRVDRDAGSHGCAVVDPASFEGNGVVLRGLVLAQGVLLRTLSGHRKLEGWGMLCPPLNLLAWMP